MSWIFSFLLSFSFQTRADFVQESFIQKAQNMANMVGFCQMCTLPVMHNGRIKPLDSLARETSIFITGSYKFKGIDPVALLFGLIGGNLIGSEQSRQRIAAMLGALYLLSLLLIWVVPHLFADQRFDDAGR